MRLLVTRPEPDASTQAQELRNRGHEPILQPLLEFKRLDFDPARLLACDALIVTSGNGLRALCRSDVEAIAGIPLYCAGAETARRALAMGFLSIAAVAETASELAARIIADGCQGNLVHVTGEHRAFNLNEALAYEGLSIHTLRVYSMTARQAFEAPVIEGIGSRTIGGAILMSPRTSEVFVTLCRNHDLLADARALRYFCLAQSVADKLASIGAKDLPVAAKPNLAALMALIPPRPSHDRMKYKDGSKAD